MRILIAELFRWVYWYPWRKIIQFIPCSLGYQLASFGGLAIFLTAKKKRIQAIQGLEYLFPQATQREIWSMIYKTFQNYAFNSIEVFYYPKLTVAKIKTMVRYEGLEKLNSALQLNRGVILAHAHFGNEEFLMPALGYAGYALHQIGSRWQPEPIVDNAFVKIANTIRQKAFELRIGYREKLPVTFHYIDQSLRSAVRAVKQNGVMLFAADGRESDQWLQLDFLGQQALFSPGLARFAKLTGAIVLPVFLVRDGDYRHRLILEDPIPIEDKSDREIIVSFVQLLEQYIRLYPCHYAKVYWLNSPFFVER